MSPGDKSNSLATFEESGLQVFQPNRLVLLQSHSRNNLRIHSKVLRQILGIEVFRDILPCPVLPNTMSSLPYENISYLFHKPKPTYNRAHKCQERRRHLLETFEVLVTEPIPVREEHTGNHVANDLMLESTCAEVKVLLDGSADESTTKMSTCRRMEAVGFKKLHTIDVLLAGLALDQVVLVRYHRRNGPLHVVTEVGELKPDLAGGSAPFSFATLN
jgi:hypothetical protein